MLGMHRLLVGCWVAYLQLASVDICKHCLQAAGGSWDEGMKQEYLTEPAEGGSPSADQSEQQNILLEEESALVRKRRSRRA